MLVNEEANHEDPRIADYLEEREIAVERRRSSGLDRPLSTGWPERPIRAKLSNMTEADVILWTGVGVGLVGLAATASNGMALILRRIRRGAAPGKRWIDRQLTSLFPSRRKEVTGSPLAGTLSLAMGFTGSLSMWVTPPPDAPVQVQLDAIRANLDVLQKRIQDLGQQSQSRHSALSSRLDALADEVRGGFSTVASRLDDEASDAARTDARGLGPVAFGFVMVAVPHPLASISLFWGVLYGRRPACNCGDCGDHLSRSTPVLKDMRSSPAQRMWPGCLPRSCPGSSAST